MKKYICLLLLFMLFSAISGCSSLSKDITRDIQEANEQSSKEAADSGTDKSANALYKQLEIPEEVEEVPLTEKGEHAYAVRAKVSIPKEAVPGIFKEEQILVDADYINQLADRVFDQGTYKQIKPLGNYSFEELTAMKDTLLKGLEDKEAETYFADKIRYTQVLYLLKLWEDNMTPPAYQEGQFTKAPDSGACMYDEIYIVEGEVAGVVYQLAAYKDGEAVNIRMAQMTEGYPEIFPQVEIGEFVHDLNDANEDTPLVSESRNNFLPDDTGNRQSYEKALEEGNLSYSVEEAGELACSMVKQLFSEDMAASGYVEFRTGANADCYALRDLEEAPYDFTQGNPPIDGYKLVLQKRVKGLSCADGEVRTIAEDGEVAATEQEYYEVTVSNRGVVDIHIRKPIYQITQTVTESPELMKFPEVMTVMEEVFKEETEVLADEGGYADDAHLISRITLSYVTVQYDGEYTLLPAWVFQEDAGGSQNTQLIISAVDGSILYRPEHRSQE